MNTLSIIKSLDSDRISWYALQHILLGLQGLPWSGFLPSISPSRCKEILDVYIRQYRCDRETQVFCETVCKICRNNPQAGNFLVYTQPPEYSHLFFSGLEQTSTYLASNILRHLLSPSYDHVGGPDEEVRVRIAIPGTQSTLTIGPSSIKPEEVCIVMDNIMSGEKDLGQAIRLALLIGIIQEHEGNNAFIRAVYHTSPSEASLYLRFSLDIPEKPKLPEEWKDKTIGYFGGWENYKKAVIDFYQDCGYVAIVLKKVQEMFESKGLGFMFR